MRARTPRTHTCRQGTASVRSSRFLLPPLCLFPPPPSTATPPSRKAGQHQRSGGRRTEPWRRHSRRRQALGCETSVPGDERPVHVGCRLRCFRPHHLSLVSWCALCAPEDAPLALSTLSSSNPGQGRGRGQSSPGCPRVPAWQRLLRRGQWTLRKGDQPSKEQPHSNPLLR